MLIAQVTDIHLGFEGDRPDELNRRRLDAVLAWLAAMRPRPDLLLMTGDLADAGDDDLSYRRLKEATADLPFPAYPMVGNHDGRAAFGAHFPASVQDGFVQYEIDAGPLRILVLDTLEEGRHGGAFCERRAAWLEARLAEQDERPTLIALHHPPIDPGLAWMGENPDAAWVRRLEALLSPARNVVGLVAGHLHRPLVTRFAGTIVAACAATAPELALDLAGIDAERPDDRPMIVEEPPAFALHRWTGRALVTHFGLAAAAPVLSRFTPPWQPLLRQLAGERGQA
ncbi:MAG: metallophosphoesterase [Alphaproteobacteria bacterium]|nr:metallophosphoesterase [Alphaproteobacteria bacterium]